MATDYLIRMILKPNLTTGVVEQYIKALPAIVTSYLDTSSSFGCSTSNPADVFRTTLGYGLNAWAPDTQMR